MLAERLAACSTITGSWLIDELGLEVRDRASALWRDLASIDLAKVDGIRDETVEIGEVLLLCFFMFWFCTESDAALWYGR